MYVSQSMFACEFGPSWHPSDRYQHSAEIAGALRLLKPYGSSVEIGMTLDELIELRDVVIDAIELTRRPRFVNPVRERAAEIAAEIRAESETS